jgi:hypothetical protein
MRARHLASTSLLSATVALGLLAEPAPALAQSLQGCGTANQRLPIGFPGSGAQYPTQLYHEKKELRGYLQGLTLADVDLPTMLPNILTPVAVLTNGASQQADGFPCSPNTSAVMPAAITPADQQELERIWVLWTQYSDTQDFPFFSGLNLHGSDFLLNAMEGSAQCQAMTPFYNWDPMLTWIGNWSYRGNPYYTVPAHRHAVLTRGAAWLALNLIMLDWSHFGGNLPLAQPPGAVFVHPAQGVATPAPGSATMNTGYELAGQLGHLAYTYLQVKSILPLPVQHAVEKHLIMFAERLHVWTPLGVQANLGIRATWGLYLAYQATNEPSVENAYLRVLDMYYGSQSSGLFFPAGYYFDDGRFDSGYNENNLLHTVRVLQLDPNAPPAVWSAAHRLFDVHGHLMFHDPDGTWYSPNQFNTRSSKSAAGAYVAANPRQGNGGGVQRFLPGAELGLPFSHASLRDARIVGPQSNTWYLPNGHLDANAADFYEDLACTHSDIIMWFNHGIQNPPGWMQLNSSWPDVAGDRIYGIPLLAASMWQQGGIRNWQDAVTNQPSLEEFPFEMEGPYVRSFDDEFIYGKFKGPQAGGRAYATLIHAGPVGAGDFDVGQGQVEIIPAGFGGGQVSMFWGPHTGAGVRGMRMGYNNPPTTDHWVDWRSWPNHSATLFTFAGEWTSSSRIVGQSSDVTFYTKNVDPNQLRSEAATSPCPGSLVPASGQTTPSESNAVATLVRVCGDLPDHVRRFSPIPNQVLGAPLPYSRSMYADEDGVVVLTTLTPAWNDVIAEAWETIPIYDQQLPGATVYAPSIVLFKLTSGQLVNVSGPGGHAPVDLVAEVYVTRANGAFRVVFDTAETVAMSPVWAAGASSPQNIAVDLGRGALPAALPPTSIGYRIEMLTDMNGFTPPP